MLEYLSAEVREELKLARKEDQRRRSRLRVHVGDAVYPVLRLWDRGFALDATSDPQLRGVVDIYDGSRHLYRALIVASTEDNAEGEVICEFKLNTAVVDTPPRDFAQAEDAPAGLISGPGRRI
jgi:hypothetical protein